MTTHLFFFFERMNLPMICSRCDLFAENISLMGFMWVVSGNNAAGHS